MKRIILTGVSIVALSASAPALAQSSSDVDQLGDGNSATVAQTGSNTSEIDQVADDALADVTQSGSGNFSDIDQNDNAADANDGGTIGVPDFDPDATVVQDGTNNSSTITQDIADGSFNQTASVDQSGAGNMSIIDQNSDGPGYTGGLRATVDQNGASISDIVQTGTNGGKNMRATVTQTD
ncbi:MAG: Curlin associated protein, partial [Pseudomonadota bacterium]